MLTAIQLKSSIEPRLVDVRDVARVYSISERSVWRLCKSGKIPAPVSFGRRSTRWRVSDLVEHIGNMSPLVETTPKPKLGAE
jgi:predicted DNA-binding transcriptional regulator AlpA